MLTSAIYDTLVNDPALGGLLSTYGGLPAVFTTDPAPGDAEFPYIVSAGEAIQVPFDTKNSRGRDLRRDVRCYAEADGSAVVVESIAERVRALLHRQPIVVPGFVWMLGECSGPIAADEAGAHGRIVTVRIIMIEEI